MNDIDLTKLSDAQLEALKMAGGDLSRLPAGMLDDINAAAQARQTNDRTIAASRIVGQGAQGFNDAAADTIGALPNASAWLSRQLRVPEALRAIGFNVSDEAAHKPILGSENVKDIIDYVATVPGRARDAYSSGSLSPFVEQRTSRFEPATPAERIANRVGEGLGSVASTVIPAGAVANAARPGTLMRGVAGTMAEQPVLQGISAAAGGAVAGATDDPMLGLATSLLVPFGAHGVQRTVSSAPAVNGTEAERRALLEVARRNGIGPLSAGRIAGGGPLQSIEDAISHMPFVDWRRAASDRVLGGSYNRAALRTAGVDATAATPEVLQAGASRLAKHSEQVAANTRFPVDPRYGAAMQDIEREVGQSVMDKMSHGTMRNIAELREAAAAAERPGVAAAAIDGGRYRSLRDELAETAAKAADPKMREAASRMIGALDDLAARSLPKDVMDEWREIHRQKGNLAIIAETMRSRNDARTAIGNVVPAELAERSHDNPDLRDIARVGTAFMGERQAGNGAAQRRALATGVGAPFVAGGAGAISPATQALIAGGAAMLPYGADLALSNPATRALLMQRYRNPSESVLSRGLVGTLAAEQALREAQNGRR